MSIKKSNRWVITAASLAIFLGGAFVAQAETPVTAETNAEALPDFSANDSCPITSIAASMGGFVQLEQALFRGQGHDPSGGMLNSTGYNYTNFDPAPGTALLEFETQIKQ